MKKLIPLLFLMLQSGGQPVNIPITVAGWKFGDGTGPYGTNGCYSGYNTGRCTQDLGVKPAEGIYTLTFNVQNRYYSYPAHYMPELSFGAQELCSPDGWAMGDVRQVTFVCLSPAYLLVDRQLPGGGPPQGQNNLMLSFGVSYWLGLSDNYSLTFTPTN